MTPTFRSTALAAVLTAISCGAMAEKIDFESFWSDPVLPDASPIAVGEASVRDFLFSKNSAWAYRKEMLRPGQSAADDVLPDVWDGPGKCDGLEAECNSSAFIMNRTRGAGGNVIEISLDPTKLGGRYIKHISLNLFHNAASGKVTALNAAGDQQADLVGFTNGLKRWALWEADLTALAFQDVTTLRFDFGNGVLGLDNLDFTLNPVTPQPPNGVPEPTSYALVGLALLAAGASRRRKA